MSRLDVVLVHVANLLVCVTGLVWFVMRHLMEPADEFALQNHPLEDEFQAAHVLTAPLLLVMLGVVWAVHARVHLASGTRARRRSGLALVFLALPMAASGYLLQVAVDGGWRDAWLLVHLVTSAAWIALFAVHQLAHRFGRARG
jgi:hypothetical protein